MIALLALCILGLQILSFGQVGISASVGENSNPQNDTAPRNPTRHVPTIEPMTIEEIRELIEREGYNFSVGETWVSKLSPKEKIKLLGDTLQEMDLSHLSISSTAISGESSTVRAPPPAFDYRDFGQVTPPKDQSTCGSCWAFAGTGRLESRILIEGGPAYDLSEENLLSCNIYGRGCGGGGDFYTVNYFSKIGACLESCAPYDATDGTPCKKDCGVVRRLCGWRIVGTGLDSENPAIINVIKQALLDYGPLYVSMDASDPAFHAYVGGVYEWWNPVSRNHGVLLIGWNDSLPHSHGSGAWIVKNSWGTGWGEGGYFKIAYGAAMFGCYVGGSPCTESLSMRESLYYYDDGGQRSSFWWGQPTDSWGAVRFIPTKFGTLRNVEFWAADDNLNYEIYIYDTISESGSYTFDDLLSYQTGSITRAGYYSIELSTKPSLSAGNDFIVAMRFNTPGYSWPVPYDDFDPISGESYASGDGITWNNLPEEGYNWDVGIRAVVQEHQTSAPIPPTSANKMMKSRAAHTIREAKTLLEAAQSKCREVEKEGDPLYEQCCTNLEEIVALIEKAEEFFLGGNYIAANNFALKAKDRLEEVMACFED